MVATWREKLRENFTSWSELSEFLQLPLEVGTAPRFFPLNLPRRIAEKIEKGKLDDPLLLQFLPTSKEEEKTEGFLKEPVNDQAFQLSPRILKKYHGRVLLLPTSACAMHCRFCFRKNFPYADSTEGDLEKELEQIGNDPTIEEVILSGGDPLSLSNQRLNEIIEQLNRFPHVKRLRFHTRFSIGIPERIDDEFLTILKNFSGMIYFILHSNHPKEWDNEVEAAHQKLRKMGVILLSQTVLLRGVNDDIETLEALFRRFINMGILPYYLHQLDRVEGTAHFEVSRNEGKALIKQLWSRLSGYGIPVYVEEIPFSPSKTPIY